MTYHLNAGDCSTASAAGGTRGSGCHAGIRCGGTSSEGSEGSEGDEGGVLGDTATLDGTCLAANGIDPVSGATIFVPSGSPSALILPNRGKKTRQSDCGDQGGIVSCSEPSETSCAVACSCADGSFTLDTSDCASDSSMIKCCKGSLCGEANIDCSATPDACSIDIVGESSAANIAVVTGAYDEIENALAKLGYGTVHPEGSTEGIPGTLDLGTEGFKIYKCGGSRDYELEDLDPEGTTYKPCEDLFGSLSEMQKYEMIFINCGANEYPGEWAGLAAAVDPDQAHRLYHRAKTWKAVSSDVAGRLRSYVEGGGALYVTDLAYDYVEQSVPEFMDFDEDTEGNPSTPEYDGAAENGYSGIISNATVSNGMMRTWLQGRRSNTVSGDFSPNDAYCDTSANGSGTSLRSDGKVRIGDFLSGWAVMDSVYAGSDTFVWIEGPVLFGYQQEELIRPLTASKKVGDGCVLYSSYHTSHSCPTTGLWPQERILQYLVFETAGSCTP